MKLLYFIPALHNSGGMERVLTAKINYLADILNFSVVVVTTEQLSKPLFFPLNDKVKLYHLDMDFNGHFNYQLFKKFIVHKYKIGEYRRKTVEIIAKEKPDICISTLGKEIEFIGKLKDKSKKIGEVHFTKQLNKNFLAVRKQSILWKYLGKIRTFQLIKSTQRLDKLVVLTKADMSDWQKTNKNVMQIYNPNVLKNLKTGNCTNKKVIAAGRLDVEKGFDILIDIWKNIAAKNPDWTLEIWGDGALRENLTKQIADNGLNNNVFLKGRTGEIQNKYIESSFYVMTSRYEGFPMVLIEAMSCGLPCISFDCRWGPGEIIEDNKNGFLVPVGNMKEMAERINTLIDSEQLRQKMSEQAKLTAEKFNLHKIMNQWDNLFKSIVTNKD